MSVSGREMEGLDAAPASRLATHPEIIYDSPHIRVIHAPGIGSTAFICFNEYYMRADGLTFWGEQLFLKDQTPAFGVVSKAPNWFPVDDMAMASVAIRAAVEAHGYTRLVSYGHSMGGYAAIKFSRQLGVSRSLASCPQMSIDPADVGTFDERYLPDFLPDLNRGMRIGGEDVQGDVYVFYDPLLVVDRRHVEAIAAATPIKHIRVPLSGHETISVLTQTGIAKQVVYGLAADDPMPVADVHRLIRSVRGQSFTYWKTRAHRLAILMPTWLKERRLALEAATSLRDDDTVVQMGWARLAHDMGNRPAASAWLEKACTPSADMPVGLIEALWQLCRHLGEPSRAADVVRHMLAKTPDNERLRGLLVRGLVEDGKSAEALEDLDRLQGFAAGKPDLLRTLVLGYQAVQRYPEAAAAARRLLQVRPLPDLVSPSSAAIAFGRADDPQRYLLSGWSRPEDRITWAVSSGSLLAIPVPRSSGDCLLTVTVVPFLHIVRPRRQRLFIYVNEHLVAHREINTAQTHTIAVEVPGNLLRFGHYALIRFFHPDATRPCDVMPVDDNRELALAFERVELSAP